MKFLSRMFSRMSITALLVLAQVFLLIWGIYKLQYVYLFISGGLKIISILVVGYLVSKDINPTIKLAWIVPILLFPVLGGLMYLLYGQVIIPKKLSKNMLKVREQFIYENVYGDTAKSSQIAEQTKAKRLFKYTEKFAGAPLYQNTSTKYYGMGEDMWPDMMEDMKKAKRYIFLEYFIINHGIMWDSIHELLLKKVKEGVEVRLIYDDVGSVFYVSKKYWKELEEEGIKCIAFNQIFPFLATILNNRDHRKITVIDGKVAYTGGINLSDEYVNETDILGTWKDSAVRLCGDAAWRFAVMFLQMWNISRYTEDSYSNFRLEKNPDFEGEFHMEGVETVPKDSIVMPYGTSPLSKEVVGENIYLQMINDAEEYLYIYTPYFIISNEIMVAIKLAAKRGVDVRIVTPNRPDKKFIFRMTQSVFPELIKAGVRVYKYTPGFVHSKCILQDGKLASVGSINMDNRSFYHHFECGVLLYSNNAVKQLEEDMYVTFDMCEEINIEWCRKNLTRFTLFDAILRLISPLL